MRYIVNIPMVTDGEVELSPEDYTVHEGFLFVKAKSHLRIESLEICGNLLISGYSGRVIGIVLEDGES